MVTGSPPPSVRTSIVVLEEEEEEPDELFLLFPPSHFRPFPIGSHKHIYTARNAMHPRNIGQKKKKPFPLQGHHIRL